MDKKTNDAPAIRGRVHFIGIGGCSMNGLAQILMDRGFEVQGSDRTTSPFTDRLAEVGIPVFIGHDPKNVEGCDTVVYSAAIHEDNPERMRAKELGIPQIERSVALGLISEKYKNVVGIAGCHGKTTITSMLALISENGGSNATVHVGGMVDFLKGGIRLGSDELFITEACEYVESFLTLHPTVVLINNIDNDHLDYFKTFDKIVNAFRKFVARMPENGLFIGCTDDENVRKLLDEFEGRKLTYGLDTEFGPDYTTANVVYSKKGCPSFDVLYHGEKLGRIELNVPGRHNMLDALAACTVALAHGDDFGLVASALAKFAPVRRRYEYYGERNGVRVFHDYAHHPAEIRAALDCGIRTPHEKLFVVFQCNSYTRAKTLFLEKVDCFKGADRVLVPDIYPGREKDDGSVHARDMVAAINLETANAEYIPTFEGIDQWLRENAKEGDIVLTLGSGDVYKQTRIFLK
ncbi:MAG: UDP-N-acetylmuramate--L-alanine ligase [Clostridia bacterium]|nr:UDP-N-acetylmuramate--L-alanine ligase [Clostridia bacterium]